MYKEYKSQDFYKGEWKNGTFWGQGTYTWESGKKCVGSWVDSEMHGEGACYEANGDLFAKGTWIHGEF